MMMITILGAFLVCLPILAVAGEGDTGGRYVAVEMQLTKVPEDIPSTAEEVFLDHNFISDVADGTWKQTEHCNYLSLKDNMLRTITINTFEGLYVLEHLNLNDNLIRKIHDQALCHLRILKRLDLAKNQLSHLSPEIFRCVLSLNYLDLSSNLLRTFDMEYSIKLRLALSGNPLQCDSMLCWLKKAEKNKNIIWASDKGGTPQTPDCVNYAGKDWEHIILHCSDKVPGQGSVTNLIKIYDKSGWILGGICLPLLLLLIAVITWTDNQWLCTFYDKLRGRNQIDSSSTFRRHIGPLDDHQHRPHQHRPNTTMTDPPTQENGQLQGRIGPLHEDQHRPDATMTDPPTEENSLPENGRDMMDEADRQRDAYISNNTDDATSVDEMFEEIGKRKSISDGNYV